MEDNKIRALLGQSLMIGMVWYFIHLSLLKLELLSLYSALFYHTVFAIGYVSYFYSKKIEIKTETKKLNQEKKNGS